jgi:hypothetical protein
MAHELVGIFQVDKTPLSFICNIESIYGNAGRGSRSWYSLLLQNTNLIMITRNREQMTCPPLVTLSDLVVCPHVDRQRSPYRRAH